MNVMSEMTNKHHARPGAIALATGLLLAPAAWFLQTNLAQMLAAQACFPHEHPIDHPAMPWLESGLTLIMIVALLAGVIGGIVSWRNWKQTGFLAKEMKDKSMIDRHVGRDLFIARAGTLASALFLFALVSTDLAWWLVSPCGGR
jgi:hypothetical protein